MKNPKAFGCNLTEETTFIDITDVITELYLQEAKDFALEVSRVIGCLWKNGNLRNINSLLLIQIIIANSKIKAVKENTIYRVQLGKILNNESMTRIKLEEIDTTYFDFDGLEFTRSYRKNHD